MRGEGGGEREGGREGGRRGRGWNILVGHSLMLVGLILLPDEGHLVRCLLNMAVQTVV